MKFLFLMFFVFSCQSVDDADYMDAYDKLKFEKLAYKFERLHEKEMLERQFERRQIEDYKSTEEKTQ